MDARTSKGANASGNARAAVMPRVAYPTLLLLARSSLSMFTSRRAASSRRLRRSSSDGNSSALGASVSLGKPFNSFPGRSPISSNAASTLSSAFSMYSLALCRFSLLSGHLGSSVKERSASLPASPCSHRARGIRCRHLLLLKVTRLTCAIRDELSLAFAQNAMADSDGSHGGRWAPSAIKARAQERTEKLMDDASSSVQAALAQAASLTSEAVIAVAKRAEDEAKKHTVRFTKTKGM